MDLLWTSDSDLVKQLYCVLRENADKICDGKSPLSLSPYAVKVLHDSFCKITNSDVRNPMFDVMPSTFIEYEIYHQLLFLFDVAQQTMNLKVLQNGNTLNGCLSVAAFNRLHMLELNCVPLQYILGLATLRSTLRHLICIGCFEKLEDLFVRCGADRTEGMPWSALVEVHLSYNNLQRLDESLMLLPKVRHLDLSHNALSDSELFLQALERLEVLNLSFNELGRFPVLGTSLTSLNLRNNRLTSLDGIETLIQLRGLDVRHNLLQSHRLLENLNSLCNLEELLLASNPLCYINGHRRLTILYLHPNVVREIIIDGQKLSYWELRHFNSKRTTPTARVIQSPPQTRSQDQVQVQMPPIVNARESRRRQPRKCRVRIVHLDEGDGNVTAQTEDNGWLIVSTEQPSSLPESSVTTQPELACSVAIAEEPSPVAKGDDVSRRVGSRRHNAVRRSNRKLRPSSFSSLSLNTDTSENCEQVSVQFPGNRLLSPVDDGTQTFKRVNSASAADGGSRSEWMSEQSVGACLEPKLDSLNVEHLTVADNVNALNNVVAVPTVPVAGDLCSDNKEADVADAMLLNASDQLDKTAEDDVLVAVHPADVELHQDGTEKDDVVVVHPHGAVDVDADVELHQDDTDDDKLDVEQQPNQTVFAEAVAETDVFSMRDVDQPDSSSKFVRASTADDLNSYYTVYEPLNRNHRFVNTNTTHFFVIEISGGLPVIDEYRLTSLVSVKVISDSYQLASDESAEDVDCCGPVLQLTFEGVKSSFVSVTYVMYDQDEAKRLIDQLELHVKARQTYLECLKCCQRFLDTEAPTEIKVTSDAADVPINFKKDSLAEVRVCPHCKSDLLLELPPGSSASRPNSVREPLAASPPSGLPRVLSGILSLTRIGSYPQSFVSPQSQSQPTSVKQPSAAAAGDQVQSATVVSNGRIVLDDVQETEQIDGYTFYNDDFRRFDPRLNLDIDLNVFKDDDEKLLLILKSPIALCFKQESSQFEGLMIVSTSNIYFAQICSATSIVDFNSWLKVRCKSTMKQPIDITVTFRGQSVIVDSPADNINAKLLICNVDWCKRFISDISALMSEYRLPLMPAICAKDRLSLNTLIQELCDEFMLKIDKEPCFHGYALSQGYQKTVRRVVETSCKDTVGVLVTMTHVCLVSEKMKPVKREPSVVTEPPDGTLEFAVLEKQATNNIVHLDIASTSPWKIALHFENELEQVPVSWNLVLRNSCSAKELADALRDSYHKVFQIPLQINCYC